MAKWLAQAEEPLVVVLLGGAHDLRDALGEYAPKARYVRVTAQVYRKVARQAQAVGDLLRGHVRHRRNLPAFSESALLLPQPSSAAGR
jgi:hypothetical protein